MNFELGMGKMHFYLWKKVYEIWAWNWNRKKSRYLWILRMNWSWKNTFMNFENESGKMLWKWNSWILNLELICHRFDQQLLFINVDKFWTNGKKQRFVNFDFGIAKLGIFILEFRCAKLCLQNMKQNSSRLVLSLA
jgi:hypothetical protein